MPGVAGDAAGNAERPEQIEGLPPLRARASGLGGAAARRRASAEPGRWGASLFEVLLALAIAIPATPARADDGATTPLETEAFAAPGEVVVRAVLSGFRDATQELQGQKGTEKQVILALPSLPTVAPSARMTLDANAGVPESASLEMKSEAPLPVPTASVTTTATVVPTAAPRSKVPAIVMGGVAVVGAAVGTGLLIGSRGQYDASKELNAEIHAVKGTCKPGAPAFQARCSDLQSAAESSNALKGGGIAAFVLAGAAATGAGIYLLWPSPKPATGSIRLVPVAAENTAGLVVSGRF